MTIDVNDLLDFYSVERLAEIWKCKCEGIIHFIRDQQSLRLACSVKGLSNQIHAIYVDDDKELIDSLVGAFNQKLPIPSDSLEDGVRLHAEDIGANQFDRLTRLSSSGSAKQKARRISDFIYEDVVNTQWAESLIKSSLFRSDAMGLNYPGGITWIDRAYDENVKAAVELESQKDFYVTGLNFDGDRFLLVEMDSKKEEVILRSILKSKFSIIPREEKERFENTTGMKTASDNGQIEPAVAGISSDPITEDLDSIEDQDDKAEGGTCDMLPLFGDGKKNTGLEWRGPSKRLSIEFAENSSGTKIAIAKIVLAKLQERNWKGRGGKKISIEGV